VHSFCAKPTPENRDWILTVTDYGEQRFISMIQKGNVVGTQFHPEKSGVVGLDILDAFLKKSGLVSGSGGQAQSLPLPDLSTYPLTKLAKRVVACLDVRSNDAGDLVVTKGDQYDCREATEAAQAGSKGEIRNLGKPVAVCKQYYDQGADEIVFLNITSFKKGVIEDLPMLKVLELSSENVFVPLTVGGGIRDYTDAEGKTWYVYTYLYVRVIFLYVHMHIAIYVYIYISVYTYIYI
jgi:glutamine amidotransferase/cyclase